jgi:hypothetical protein
MSNRKALARAIAARSQARFIEIKDKKRPPANHYRRDEAAHIAAEPMGYRGAGTASTPLE